MLIISARFSEFKGIAEKCLDTNGIRYDKIIYDTPRGERILINDRKPWGGGLDTAYSINIDRGCWTMKICFYNEGHIGDLLLNLPFIKLLLISILTMNTINIGMVQEHPFMTV